MNDAVTVGGIERHGDLGGDSQGAIERQRAARQAFASVSPSSSSITRNATPSCSPMSNGADVRMTDPGDGASLTPETFELPWTCARRRPDRLDRHESIQPRILRAIDFPHAPRIEKRQHFVGSDARARRERHSRWWFAGTVIVAFLTR